MLFGQSKLGHKLRLPEEAEALPGRARRPFDVPVDHFVLGTPIEGEPPEAHLEVVLGMGCFWGAERLFWEHAGAYTTAVGYAGGSTANPTYEEVCSGLTGHAEVVRVVVDPAIFPLEEVLRVFWEGHDPTQGMRQGNDVGTQYRSAVYAAPALLAVAEASRDRYQAALDAAGLGRITTEIEPAPTLYYAEGYHQQYLAKNPHGYCGIGGVGVSCPSGIAPA